MDTHTHTHKLTCTQAVFCSLPQPQHKDATGLRTLEDTGGKGGKLSSEPLEISIPAGLLTSYLITHFKINPVGTNLPKMPPLRTLVPFSTLSCVLGTLEGTLLIYLCSGLNMETGMA